MKTYVLRRLILLSYFAVSQKGRQVIFWPDNSLSFFDITIRWTTVKNRNRTEVRHSCPSKF